LSSPPFFANGSFSTTRTGWTAGGGLQYAITNNWRVFGEYRFSDFGTIRNGAFPSLPSGAFFNANRHLQENQVQGGFSYKFDTYAPASVVSKILIASPLEELMPRNPASRPGFCAN
jgi:outer membrane immunogenic protein